MAKRETTSEPVLEILWDLYCRSIKYQRVNNGITVLLTFDEYLSLWSAHRIRTLTEKQLRGSKAVDFYLKNTFRPVLSWVSKAARELGGAMTVHNAKILNADDSKKLFQFQKGDQHSEASRAAIGASKQGKAQSADHVKKRTQGQVGVKRGPMSEAAKAKLRETRAARNAATSAERPA